jgi:NTE family protein
MSIPSPLSLTLALGGGGAKSAAQAGVLSVLEENGLPVGPLVGVSGGGVVAILYGLGYTPRQICDAFAETQLTEVWEPDPDGRAIFGGEKVRARFRKFVGDKTFADLLRPAMAMAMDFDTGQEVRINSGPLMDALMATIAIPGLLPAVRRDGRLLTDCGLINILPLNVARELGPRVVAVDILHHTASDEVGRLFESRSPLRYATLLSQRLGFNPIVESVYLLAKYAWKRLAEYSVQLYPPDVLIRPAVGDIGLLEFDAAEQAYALGQAAAQAALPELTALAYPDKPPIWKRLLNRIDSGSAW